MIIKVRVKPHAGEQSVEKVQLPGFDKEEGEVYFVKLKSMPDEGRANLELVKVLKNYFKKPVKIKSGFTSKNKIVEVDD